MFAGRQVPPHPVSTAPTACVKANTVDSRKRGSAPRPFGSALHHSQPRTSTSTTTSSTAPKAVAFGGYSGAAEREQRGGGWVLHVRMRRALPVQHLHRQLSAARWCMHNGCPTSAGTRLAMLGGQACIEVLACAPVVPCKLDCCYYDLPIPWITTTHSPCPQSPCPTPLTNPCLALQSRALVEPPAAALQHPPVLIFVPKNHPIRPTAG